MAVTTVIDLSDRVRLEESFQQAQKMEVVGQFSSMMAHDFRNYLTAIGGFAQLVQEDIARGAPHQPDLDEILRVVGQAREQVGSMLAFSRPEPVDHATLDVGDHLARHRPFLARLLEPASRLQLDAPLSLPAVHLAPAAFTQLLANLLVNARQAMEPDGGTVRIEASLAGGRPAAAWDDPDAPEPVAGRPSVRVVVSDEGCGMDEATRKRIFDPFFTTKAPEVGTGLGLPSVLSIVERAGGHLEVRSAPGAGTTFVIELPAA